MAVGTDRRSKKTASRSEHALLLQPGNNAMSFSPSKQVSEAGGLIADCTSTPSPTDHPDSMQVALHDQESIIQSNHHLSKKRRSSKSKVTSDLRRSSSTPHMRHLALGNSGDLSPTSNKPRNKLGYHRTSVACGHCRRRKIRCLLAPEDLTGRCANCIRLKKECNFYPVEHNPDHPQASVASSKDASVRAPLTPTASSPHHPSTVAGERVGDFRAPYPGVSSTPSANFAYHGEVDHDSHQTAGGMPVQPPSFPYPHAIETQWPPTNTYLPSSTIAESPQSTTSYWRQSPTTANSAYGSESNVSGSHTPAAMSTSSTMSYGHQDNHWNAQQTYQQPTRSMSYGNIEGLAQQYPSQGLGIHHEFARRTSPYPYPTSIDTSTSTMHATTVGGSTSAPLSAPVVPNQSYYPQSWNSYDAAPHQGPQMPMPGRSMSAQWYSEPGHLDRVQEEGVAPMTFHQPGMPQFYSGA
ncbi:hypothetical protein ACN47E_007906 [Coniothyrium glycines]